MFSKAAAALAVTLLVSGCRPAPDPARFSRVQAGMARTDVHALLGQPDKAQLGVVGAYQGLTEQWQADDALYTVQYLNGQVKLKTITPTRRN